MLPSLSNDAEEMTSAVLHICSVHLVGILFSFELQNHFYVLKKEEKKNFFHLLSFPLLSACWGCYYGTLWGRR